MEQVISFLGFDTSNAKYVDNLPVVDQQSNPLKDEWIARYRAEIAAEEATV